MPAQLRLHHTTGLNGPGPTRPGLRTEKPQKTAAARKRHADTTTGAPGQEHPPVGVGRGSRFVTNGGEGTWLCSNIKSTAAPLYGRLVLIFFSFPPSSPLDFSSTAFICGASTYPRECRPGTTAPVVTQLTQLHLLHSLKTPRGICASNDVHKPRIHTLRCEPGDSVGHVRTCMRACVCVCVSLYMCVHVGLVCFVAL